jgi:hypothetical protein
MSLGWMAAEGAVGLTTGLAAGSAALTGWALGSCVEALASMIVIWRFTGSRELSPAAERQAGRAVGVSFWLLAPWIAAQAGRDLAAVAAPVIARAIIRAGGKGPGRPGPGFRWPRAAAARDTRPGG